jgi:G3E family GTPase
MLPATIVTGFLGSGKTTLLNRLLLDARLARSLVVINELGEVGIDHLIVAAPAENVRLLSSGCLCCRIGGELVETLAGAWRARQSGAVPAFERVLIETSGLADPVPIAHTLVNDASVGKFLHLESIITVIDALYGASQLVHHDEARKQVAVADLVLHSKTDLAAPADSAEVRAAIAQLNPLAEQLTVSELDPQRLFALRRQPFTILQAKAKHSIGIRSFVLSHDEPVSKTALATWLSMLASFKGADLLRVKGIANVEGEPYVIDVVQSVIHEPFRLGSWPAADRRTAIVFIVRNLERKAIERTFSAFAMADTLPATGGLDAEAYARFRAAAETFVTSGAFP